jgi:iron complex outermembrane recepter protein
MSNSLLLQCTTMLDVNGKECERIAMPRQLIFLLLISASAPALAQRTTNNAVTASDDAFGRAVGNEKIGIYSSEDVRGFNPIEAGNARIEGLYFDQQITASNRLIDSSAIRVGYAARGYPFPAPTGIVDLRLEKFEGKSITSAEIETDEQGNIGGSLQAKVALNGEKLGLSFGQGFRMARIPYGRFGHFNSHAVLLTWRPDAQTEVTLFWSEFITTKQSASPVVFPATGVIPPHVDRHAYLGQSWADGNGKGYTEGAIFKRTMGAFQLDAGLFRSIRTDPLSFADLLRGTDASGATPAHLIVADRDNHSASTSGEVRLSRHWDRKSVSHRLQLSVKARDQSRAFGGAQRYSVGAAQFGVQSDSAEPFIPANPNDESQVKQVTLGLGYDLVAKHIGSLSLAIQKSDYRKDTDFANPLLASTTTRDKPWLYNASGTINLTAGLSAYAGIIRGLEESVVAPDLAVNRGEAPPAIRTSQKEAGLRYAITPKLSVIAGVFEVRKPYYNLDPSLRFRQLGTLSNRGLEVSLAGTLAPGLTIVAGTLLLDPALSGPDVAAGLIGARPVGTFKRHSIANFDWMPHGQAIWSFDLALESFSKTMANTANSFSGPARETVALGTRYRFHIGTTKWLARVQVQNLLDDYGWKVSSSGGFTFTPPRTLSMSLAADL